MSQKLNALAANLDSSIVDYVDEAIRVAMAERSVIEQRNTTRAAALQSEIDGLKIRIAELEGQQALSSQDDKYALTKAKLVRVMKENGWYD